MISGQRPLDAGPGHVDQHVHAREQPVDHRRVPQVAVHQVLARPQRLQRPAPARRAQVDPALEQGGPQHLADVPAGPRECDLRHAAAPVSSLRCRGRIRCISRIATR